MHEAQTLAPSKAKTQEQRHCCLLAQGFSTLAKHQNYLEAFFKNTSAYILMNISNISAFYIVFFPVYRSLQNTFSFVATF